MNVKTPSSAAALFASIAMLQGCGEDSPVSMAPVQPQVQMLDTQQVLALAQVTDDTSDPVPVGNGGLLLADADDNTSDPIPVG